MKRFYTASLALLLVAFFGSNLLAQILPRYFPVIDATQFYYDVTILPVHRMVDGGYLLDFGFGGPNIHGPVYRGSLVRTDSSWVPQWGLYCYSRAGLGNFTFADTTILHVESSSFTKLRQDGTQIWYKYVNTAPGHGSEMVQGYMRGNEIVCSGNLYQRDVFGLNIYEYPMQLAIDTAGNALWSDSMVIPGDIYTHVFDADNDSLGTWLIGTSASNAPNSSYPFIAHVDTLHSVTFANSFGPLPSAQFNVVHALSNGEAMAGGSVNNQLSGQPSLLIARFSASGGLLWAQQIDSAFDVTDFHELSGGDVLVLGSRLHTGGQYVLPVVIRVSATGNVIWAKSAGFSGCSFGPPMDLGANNWLFPVMGDDPMIMETDGQVQSNACPTWTFTVNSLPLTFGTTPITLQVFTNNLSTVATSGFSSAPQAYVDSCGSILTQFAPKQVTKLEVYPNPTNGQVHLNAAQAITRILVIDALGREVAQSRPGSSAALLEIPAKGPHWLKIELEDGTFASRMVVRM